MTAVSKNVYFDVLENIVDKGNNAGHRTIKIKSIDVTSDSYAECNKNSNVTKPKFKVGDHVRISKYKSIFAGYKDILKIGKKFLLFAKLRIQFRGHM